VKRFVDGEEADLVPGAAQVSRHGDRLIVKSDRGAKSALAVRVGDKLLVSYDGRQYTVEKASRTSSRTAHAGTGEIHAPMSGAIADVLVVPGQAVSVGAKLVVLEAMKTQQAFTSPFDGVVESVDVKIGDQVSEYQLLAKVVANPE